MEATMKMNDRYAWPDATTREANSVDLARRLRREIGGYEREFGVPSASLAEALATGRVAEDERVCNWLIALETIRALQSGE